MMNVEKNNQEPMLLHKSFWIKKGHLDLIKRVNPTNDSVALRYLLDEYLRFESKIQQRKDTTFLHNLVTVIGLGCLFMLFGFFNMKDYDITSFVTLICIGLFFMFYAIYMVLNRSWILSK